MTGHFISIGALFVCIFLLAFFVGREVERNKLAKILKPLGFDKVNERIELRKKLADGTWLGIIYVLFFAIVWYIFSYQDIRQDYIERYKDGKIIEVVNYKYEKINGEKVLKDSTITYKKYK